MHASKDSMWRVMWKFLQNSWELNWALGPVEFQKIWQNDTVAIFVVIWQLVSN
jgi:hypothetical protein